MKKMHAFLKRKKKNISNSDYTYTDIRKKHLIWRETPSNRDSSLSMDVVN